MRHDPIPPGIIFPPMPELFVPRILEICERLAKIRPSGIPAGYTVPPIPPP